MGVELFLAGIANYAQTIQLNEHHKFQESIELKHSATDKNMKG
jgi:hypothetical protein